jgi:hypothetical protein
MLCVCAAGIFASRHAFYIDGFDLVLMISRALCSPLVSVAIME